MKLSPAIIGAATAAAAAIIVVAQAQDACCSTDEDCVDLQSSEQLVRCCPLDRDIFLPKLGKASQSAGAPSPQIGVENHGNHPHRQPSWAPEINFLAERSATFRSSTGEKPIASACGYALYHESWTEYTAYLP